MASKVNAQVLAANKVANSDSEKLALASLVSFSVIVNGIAVAVASLNTSAAMQLPAGCRDVMALAPQSDIDSVAAVYGIDPGEPPFGK